jgi:amino acid transporter
LYPSTEDQASSCSQRNRIEVFGIAFSIMGLLPSIASTLAYSIPSGPAGMVWSWFLASMFIFIVGLAMADLGSAMPTSGGLYWYAD